jgi:hypothetical protein
MFSNIGKVEEILEKNKPQSAVYSKKKYFFLLYPNSERSIRTNMLHGFFKRGYEYIYYTNRGECPNVNILNRKVSTSNWWDIRKNYTKTKGKKEKPNHT